MSKAKGFIIDSPNALITTPDGDTSVTASSSGEITFGGDTITINGGWSPYDLLEIDTKSTIEISLTDAEWKMQNMKLATGGTLTTGTANQKYFGVGYSVVSNEITIPLVADAKSVRINGMTEVETAPSADTEFQVTLDAESTTVTFNTDVYEDGTEVAPSFDVSVDNSEVLTVKTSDAPGTGEVILQFPVYEGKEEKSGVCGYMQITVYKAKIKRENKAGGSYKSHSTFELKLKGLDPRRSDKHMFEMAFIPVA
ncbi:MAG: hypothetical protein GY714_23475 [Desulfobacterales bacterium]|nr:hypothetical protein [Desulfobacterales bacterium]